MKVLVTMKIKAVNGPEAGITYEQSGVMETESSVSEYGIIDRLTVNWVHLTPYEREVIQDADNNDPGISGNG